LPSHLKTKFGLVNKVIAQHNQEFDQIFSSQIKDGNLSGKSSTQLKEDLIQLYKGILKKSGDISDNRPSMGTTLQMDRNIIILLKILIRIRLKNWLIDIKKVSGLNEL